MPLSFASLAYPWHFGFIRHPALTTQHHTTFIFEFDYIQLIKLGYKLLHGP